MGEIQQGYSVVEMLVCAYLTLALIKTILCLSNVSVVAGVLRRRLGGGRYAYYLALAAVLVVVFVFLSVVPALIRERSRFFLVYSDREVMRDVLSGI